MPTVWNTLWSVIRNCKMELIGICGGIGSGKSVVSRILRLRGYEVYDCDYEARILMSESDEVRRALTGRWGENIYLADGALDRKAVSAIVFADDAERLWLNEIGHGMVRYDIKSWKQERSDTICFVESAILFESGVAEMCDSIWQVVASPQIRRERIMKRSGMSLDRAEACMASQLKEQLLLEKSGRTVIEIPNDGASASDSLLLTINELCKGLTHSKNSDTRSATY